jgi:hypothetical protein
MHTIVRRASSLRRLDKWSILVSSSTAYIMLFNKIAEAFFFPLPQIHGTDQAYFGQLMQKEHTSLPHALNSRQINPVTPMLNRQRGDHLLSHIQCLR